VLALLERPDQVLVALEPLRRELLARLAEPASATELAAALGLGRQKVGYHLKALEEAGLVTLVEERPRRGFTERVLQATASAYVVDPGVLSATPTAHDLDRHAAERLVAVAADTVRDVTRMQSAAAARDERLLTFTVEADVAFDQPADLEAFTDALVGAVRTTAERFHHPGGRRYRVVVGGHPTPAREE
jgi:DNA-binding transcriptional ArsR family regulator